MSATWLATAFIVMDSQKANLWKHPANTGTAGAMHRVGFFAGAPAPTGMAQAWRLVRSLA